MLKMPETLGIAGSGTIACGLATVASGHGDVILWARSQESAERAQASVARACERSEGAGDAGRVSVVSELDELRRATSLVEAIVEDHGSKAELLAELGELTRDAGTDAVLASTTSSLSIAELAQASGHAERFAGLHVFNPVARMALVEVVFPPAASATTRERTRQLCLDICKTPVEVPDIPGFVVNRLLFPYLFDAVRLMVENGIEPDAVDACMKLGAGMPTGPIALLDYIGLDVSQAIGQSIGLEVPKRLLELVGAGALGRKAGRGFYDYSSVTV
jgi:3-hydroxybutyryl-CoA dehydrogenase